MFSHEWLVIVGSGGGVTLADRHFLSDRTVINAVQEFAKALQEALAVDTGEDALVSYFFHQFQLMPQFHNLSLC